MSLRNTFAATFLLATSALAGPSAKLTLDPSHPGREIPNDFAGLSCEMQLVSPDKSASHFFRPDNAPLIATFKSLNLRSLRVGGNTADKPSLPLPTEADIDSLFAFAKAADCKIIFTLRLREGDPTDASRIAKYIMSKYSDQVTAFAVGNEPNVYAKTYPEYRDLMKKYYPAIRAAAPNAQFCGPSPTPGKVAWTRDFVQDFGDSDSVALITQHAYPGNSARKVTDPAAARLQMLSPEWVQGYQKMHDTFVPAAIAKHKPVRIEEVNSFFNGGAKDVSDTLASSLWALDYMYWWASHDVAGLNFHSGDHVAAGEELTPCRYALFWTSDKGYNVHPIGYALKAFSLSSHGSLIPVTLDTTSNITAYAVSSPGHHLYVTLINKEPSGDPASISIYGLHPSEVRTTFLQAPDLSSTTNITLGHATIDDTTGDCPIQWTSLPGLAGDGSIPVSLPPASAAIVDLTVK